MEREIERPSMLGSPDREGFVVRTAAAIRGDRFGRFIAKFVRRGHIQTDSSWTRKWKKVKLVEIQKVMEFDPLPIGDGNDVESGRSPNSKRSKKARKGAKAKSKGTASLKTSCIICVGPPGSGKSTFSKLLCAERSEWRRCGTDLVKEEAAKHGVKRKRHKEAVFDFVARRIKEGQKVIVRKQAIYSFLENMGSL